MKQKKCKFTTKIDIKRDILMMTVLIVIVGIGVLYPDIVFAKGTIKDSVLVTGTKKLIDDIVGAIQIVGPVSTGVYATYCGFKLTGAEDNEVPIIKKRIKISIMGGVISLVGATLFKIVLSYYGTIR